MAQACVGRAERRWADIADADPRRALLFETELTRGFLEEEAGNRR